MTESQVKTDPVPWQEANQRSLMAEVDLVRCRLEVHSKRGGDDGAKVRGAERAVAQAREALSSPSALDRIAAAFSLSPFERDVLTLCAGMELSSSFADTCANAQPGTNGTHPTFGLALAALPDPHWSALLPEAPLRRWRLLELGRGPLTSAAISIDERILHQLTGLGYFDDRLRGFIEPVSEYPELLDDEHQVLARQLCKIWAGFPSGRHQALLCGPDAESIRALTARVCAELGLRLAVLQAHFIPSNPTEFEAVLRLWTREALLVPSALLLECHHESESARLALVERWVANSGTPLILSCDRPCVTSLRPAVSLEVKPPTAVGQEKIWTTLLSRSKAALNGDIARLAEQFRLTVPAIRNACVDGFNRARATGRQSGDNKLGDALWDACVRQGRPPLEPLAQRIESHVSWDDLVLPTRQLETLRQIPVHVRRRRLVHDTWGFGKREQRGLGISALFCGPSGTGKTLAVEVIANELRLDLFRIDLSSVVSKYIGETESNLRKVFDAAEVGGAVLLFDEADALFGKRSEVKDSHDRFANIEICYLLQRMEAYRGLAILTTNRKDDLDTAFLRRIRFVISFPFPNKEDRTRIWQCVFPTETPTDGLDYTRLAQLNISGGNIRNIALNAAFHAAEAGQSIRMPHLLAAAHTEYAKIERSLTEAETRGWI